MDNGDDFVWQAFSYLPFLVLILFTWTYSDWVMEHLDTFLPAVVIFGLILIQRAFPSLWEFLKAVFPALLIVGGIIGLLIFMIFGGGADEMTAEQTTGGLSGRSRQRAIEQIR